MFHPTLVGSIYSLLQRFVRMSFFLATLASNIPVKQRQSWFFAQMSADSETTFAIFLCKTHQCLHISKNNVMYALKEHVLVM